MGFLTGVAEWLGVAAPVCALCGGRVGTRHRIDSRGLRFCLSHGTAGLCPECGSLGARPTPDGPRLCGSCASSGVAGEAHARAILIQVQQEIQALGFHLPHTPFPLHLVPWAALNAEGDAPGRARCQGRLHWRRWPGEGPEVQGITLLRGLPPVSCGRILAHELGHVWLLKNAAPDLPPRKAEGTCELCAWLWLTARPPSQATFKAKAMERNPDPIYGEGFRAARRVYLAGGMASLRRWLGEG